jgi:hypothetical protein
MKLVKKEVKETVFTFELTTKELNTLTVALGGSSDSKRSYDAPNIGLPDILTGREATNLYSRLHDVALADKN